MSGRHPTILTMMAAIYSDRGELDKVEAIRVELNDRAKPASSQSARWRPWRHQPAGGRRRARCSREPPPNTIRL
jgi:hypothetical protein